MDIKAIIMAGGEGSRLRPMTVHLPKPLVPLLGKPVMGYTLDLVKKHGIEDVGVTLWYQPKKIRAAFGRGDKLGVRIQYFEETEPLGTAGSIRMAKDKLKDTFFVLSGDGLTDCDLTAAMAYHKEKKALATLVLKRVRVPLPYGVVMIKEDGKIVRFVEKPDWSGVYSNLVNTGIYILEPDVLEMIPENGMPDFGKDIFPALLKNNERLYGYEMDGYWCDVGNAQAYRTAQQDLLSGRVKLDAAAGIHPEARLGENVHLHGNFYIGKGSVIERGASIRDAVIGENCVIGSGAVIENSCLWNRVGVGVKARINGSVLCDGSAVRSEAALEEGCVVGQGAAVGAHAALHAGVKVWPGIKIAAGSVCTENLIQDESGGCVWEENGAACHRASFACRLTMAFVRAARPKRIITAHLRAPALQAVVSGTLGTAGVSVMQGGWMTEAMLREAVAALKADGGILAAEDKLIFVDKDGRLMGNTMRRNIDAVLLCGDQGALNHEKGVMSSFAGAREVYLSSVVPDKEKKALLSPVVLCCADQRVMDLALEGLQRMNVRNIRSVYQMPEKIDAGETCFVLQPDGKELFCYDADGEMEKTQLMLLRIKRMANNGQELFDLPEIPRAAQRIQAFSTEKEGMDFYRQERIMQDGVAALFELCDAMKDGPLKEQMESLPPVHMVCRQVDCREGDKGRILYELCKKTQSPYTLSRGMQVRDKRGYATIVPDQNKPAVRIFSEAASMETANELCDFYHRAIRLALENGQKDD